MKRSFALLFLTFSLQASAAVTGVQPGDYTLFGRLHWMGNYWKFELNPGTANAYPIMLQKSFDFLPASRTAKFHNQYVRIQLHFAKACGAPCIAALLSKPHKLKKPAELRTYSGKVAN